MRTVSGMLAGCTALALAAIAAPANAHLPDVTSTTIWVAEPGVLLVYTVPEADLRTVPGAPSGSGAASGTFEGLVRDAFRLRSDAGACALVDAASSALEDIQSHQYRLHYRCPATPRVLEVEYRLDARTPFVHENFVDAHAGGAVRKATLWSRARTLHVPVEEMLAQSAGALEARFPERVRPAPDVGRFFALGVEHILVGIDHVLFVVALILVPMAYRRLAVLVTSFTLGHSVTLGLATLGVVALEPRVAETLIALSIAWVAAENVSLLRRSAGDAPALEAVSRGLLARRSALALVFGLVHGFGFSGVLREIGLPPDGALAALFLFNAGVEAGQLLVIAVLLPGLALAWRRPRDRRLAIACSAIIGGAGVLWAVERAVFW